MAEATDAQPVELPGNFPARDSWDPLGLSKLKDDEVADFDAEVKHGQVCMGTSADYMQSRKVFEQEQRLQMQAFQKAEREARLERLNLERQKKDEKMLQPRGFQWTQQKAFEWRQIHHAMLGGVGPTHDGGLITEQQFNPTPMRMYTDHRVMGAIVLPGVSHVSLFAATATVGMPMPVGAGFSRGGGQEFHISIKEVLFERPYIVNEGLEIIKAIEGAGMEGGFGSREAMLAGTQMTYCRCTAVSKEGGAITPKYLV